MLSRPLPNQSTRRAFGAVSIVAALACGSIASRAQAESVSSAKSGNWTDASTWGIGRVPAPADYVVLLPDHQVTIPAGKSVTNAGGIQITHGTLINNGTLRSSGELIFQGNSKGARNNGTLISTGSMKVLDVVFVNAGTLTSEKSLLVSSTNYAAQLVNTSTGTLHNKGSFQVLSVLTNDGKLNNTGQFSLGAGGPGRPSKLEGAGSITNEKTGTFTMAGNLAGNGPFVNLGSVRNVMTGSDRQEGFWVRNTFDNRGTVTSGFLFRIEPTGTLTNAKEGTVAAAEHTLVNRGTIDNYGALTTGGCEMCRVANVGTLRNHCGATLGRVTEKPATQVPCQTADAGVTAAPVTPPAAASTYGTTVCSTIQGTSLRSGSEMTPGSTLQSPNKKYELAYQTDGNVVVYELPGRKPLWASNTSRVPPSKLAMQSDGNVVARKSDGSVAWSTNTAGSAGAVLSLQDDGNLVVYRKDSCQAAWARR